MADVTNGKPKHKLNIGMGVSLAVAIIGLVMGWGLLAQSWAKDAGHQVMLERIDQAAATSARNEVANEKQDLLLNELVKATERQVVLQEAMQKQLDRIERKVSP